MAEPPLNLTLQNFDFALRVAYIPAEFEPAVGNNLDEYIDLSVLQANFFWTVDQFGNPTFNKTKYRTPLEACGYGRLGITDNSSDYLGIRNTYLCPPADMNY